MKIILLEPPRKEQQVPIIDEDVLEAGCGAD